jgi:hypothetical protein
MGNPRNQGRAAASHSPRPWEGSSPIKVSMSRAHEPAPIASGGAVRISGMDDERLNILKWGIVLVMFCVMGTMAWYILHRVDSWIQPSIWGGGNL